MTPVLDDAKQTLSFLLTVKTVISVTIDVYLS